MQASSKTIKWDENKKMIVDTSAPEDSEDIDEKENLIGFEFTAAVEEELQ